jgi:hypothetical protein
LDRVLGGRGRRVFVVTTEQAILTMESMKREFGFSVLLPVKTAKNPRHF